MKGFAWMVTMFVSLSAWGEIVVSPTPVPVEKKFAFEPDPLNPALYPACPSAASPKDLVEQILGAEDDATAQQAIAALKELQTAWPWDQLQAQMEEAIAKRGELVAGGRRMKVPPARIPEMAKWYTASQARLLNKPNMTWTWKQLEAWVREGPPYAAGLPTGLTQRYVACDHVKWNSTYFLYVPTTYDPKKSYPLLIIMNGGNGDMGPQKVAFTALTYLDPWIALAEKRGWILASPAAAKGWGEVGYSLAFTTVGDVAKRYHVDPDRVYGWGQSMGGHACWRFAISAPDRWAGLSPVCGGYATYDVALPITNNLALYQVWGETDPHSAGLAEINRHLAQALKDLGYDHRMVGKPGGHDLFEDEFPKILDYFDAHPRTLYPKHVIAHIWNLDWTSAKDFEWKKPLPWARRQYWLECVEKFDDAKNAHVIGDLTGPNAIALTLENVKKIKVYLHDKMGLDFDKPIQITVNGQPPKSYTAERSIDTLFESVRTYRDRGRIYFAALTLELPPTGK